VEQGTADLRAAVNAMWFLMGRCVTLRQEGNYGATALDYEETLPAGIAPLLVLDASARVRETYRLWSDYRGGVEFLPAATKDYTPLTINVWSAAGGKAAFRSASGSRLIDGIVRTIDSKPREQWLVVHHKLSAVAVAKLITSRLAPRSAPVHFVNWGAHEGTNAYAEVPNVILAGTLFYRPSFYEALGRLSAGKPSATGAFDSSSRNAVMRGEHRHLILQALCRGRVRKCEGAACPPVNAYIIASERSGIREELPTIFPGATVRPWRPLPVELRGHVKAAAAFVLAKLGAVGSNPSGVPFKAVMGHLGMSGSGNFANDVRKHESFRLAMADHGIVEWPEGRARCFRHAYDAYFGGPAESPKKPRGRPPKSAATAAIAASL
ncbi:MAG: hypothetical protein KIT16_11985, partial [Rhodospirillaceae bacterium]|nr:hypothetical protein [Rhodospirillaceae bacterium]